jgi:hypothetical protein
MSTESLSLVAHAPRLTADKLSVLIHTFTGKEPLLPSELIEFFNDQDLDKLRVSRPSKLIFLCGGAINSKKSSRPSNLRDYLLRYDPIKTQYKIVLAEAAVTLFRETDYKDLISFEEHIAQISSIVLVIAESPGSLAELGAFSSNEHIKPSLRVLMQEKLYNAESFVKLGPIRRMTNERRELVGVYPWSSLKDGRVVISSLRRHKRAIVSFINDHVDSTPTSRAYSSLNGAARFYLIYWVVFLCLAVSRSTLSDYVRALDPSLSESDIRNALYCMQLAGWVDSVPYGPKDYVFVNHDADPFDYSFKAGARGSDSKRRKMAVTVALRAAEKLDRAVLDIATTRRAQK